MEFQTILFDFDGVLCKDRFYEKNLLPKYPDIYSWIQINIFGDKELVRKWMRGQICSAEVNKLISEHTNIAQEKLNELYEESIHGMKLEGELVDLIKSLKKSGKKIGIVTDNMDIFTKITVPNHKLDTLFDIIINSADYGALKTENDGKLFDVALVALNEKIENSLMIDDSEKTIEFYKQKGGNGFLYKNFSKLESFLQK